MRLALLVRANVHDRSGFAAVHNHSGLSMRTFSFALRTAILTLVQRVWSFGVDLPGRALRNLDWLWSIFHQWRNTQFDKFLDLRSVATRIRA